MENLEQKLKALTEHIVKAYRELRGADCILRDLTWVLQAGIVEEAQHIFGPEHPVKQGMNHTAQPYRVCTKCGHSDVFLKDKWLKVYPWQSEGMWPCQK